MDKQEYNKMVKALSLLHDFISNYGAKEEHYIILNSAEDILREYENKEE